MKTEKTIRIFIGSSIIDLELERMKLMSFIQGLNNKYHERGVFIEGYICEETPNDMRAGGSQKMHNDYISGNADATIFMFFHKAGEFTMKELELARQAFLEKGKPNVFVFFKAVDGAPDIINDDIQRAVSLVFDDYGHYYKMFDDVDTVKLELLQFLMDQLPGRGELVVKDGAVYMNGALIKDISAANVFAYQNNPNLKKLKERMDSLLKDMTNASANGDADEALRISGELGEVRKEYHELESALLKQIMYFHELNRRNEKPDPRRMEALRLLEHGDSRAVQALITREEMDMRAEAQRGRRELAEAQLLVEDKNIVEDIRIRIMALETDLENPNRFNEIEHAYESAYEAAKNAKDYGFIYDYAAFLYGQKNYPKAIAIAEKLKHIYDDPDNRGKISDQARANLLNLLGTLYDANKNLQKVEAVYLESLAIARSIFKADPTPDNEDSVALGCNNLGAFYADNGKPTEAEKLYLEALEIRRRLAETVSREAYEPDVAMTCNNLAILYKNNGKPAEAEKLYLEALEIYKRLAETVSRKAYEPYVAMTCNNLGAFYDDNGKPAEAEKLYLEALEIRRRLAETVSREAYEPYVATTCNNLGIFYADNGRMAEAEKLYLEALQVYRRHAEPVSREAYEPDVAMTCNNLGALYHEKLGKPAEAEKLYLEALEIRKRLASTVSREAYEPDVAHTCNNLGVLYYEKLGKPTEAEKLYLEALEIRRRLAETVSRKAYEPYVADTCNNLGLFYADNGRMAEAEKLYLEALEIYKRLAETVSREAY
ncbi:MAG: tetratricopeptide repeat protein, partial [Clostridia bacterium]|nr:tetratricopeptide repeat protein [Clostridia bacterium]